MPSEHFTELPTLHFKLRTPLADLSQWPAFSTPLVIVHLALMTSQVTDLL